MVIREYSVNIGSRENGEVTSSVLYVFIPSVATLKLSKRLQPSVIQKFVKRHLYLDARG